MSRVYTITATATITAAQTDVDLVEISPADDEPVRLIGYILGQTSEIGDAQEEGIRVSVIRLPATVTSGSGGNATPQSQVLDSADVAADFASETMNTTVATTSGTAVTVDDCAWNLRGSPLERWWMDERLRPIVKQGEALVIRWQTTVADDVVAVFSKRLASRHGTV